MWPSRYSESISIELTIIESQRRGDRIQVNSWKSTKVPIFEWTSKWQLSAAFLKKQNSLIIIQKRLGWMFINYSRLVFFLKIVDRFSIGTYNSAVSRVSTYESIVQSSNPIFPTFFLLKVVVHKINVVYHLWCNITWNRKQFLKSIEVFEDLYMSNKSR